MRLFLIVLAAALLPASALAQTGTVTGRVVDAATQQTLPGASVLIPGQDSLPAGRAVTDLDGQFSIGGLAPGTYSARASFAGFETAVRTDVAVQPSRPTLVLFELREAAASAGEAVVTAASSPRSPTRPSRCRRSGPRRSGGVTRRGGPLPFARQFFSPPPRRGPRRRGAPRPGGPRARGTG